jgi:hypothetical protein
MVNNEMIQVSFAVSDANRADEDKGLRIPRDLSHYIDLYREGTHQQRFQIELQPEKVFVTHIGQNKFAPKQGNPWGYIVNPYLCTELSERVKYLALQETLNQCQNTIYVHQPCQAIDWVSENTFKRRQAIETAKMAMLLTQMLSAKVFDFHLLQKDQWALDRFAQIQSGYDAFDECREFYQEQRFSFTPAIENLEFPKFPSTLSEMLSVFDRYKNTTPTVQLVLDIPHLWRSRNIILENRATVGKQFSDMPELALPFHEYLRHCFQCIPQDRIAYYHLAGAYGIVTHGIPGIHDGDDPFTLWIELDGRDEYYDERNEMNIRRVTDLLIEFVLNAGFPLKIIMEIHNRTDRETLRGVQVFRSRLFEKALSRVKE